MGNSVTIGNESHKTLKRKTQKAMKISLGISYIYVIYAFYMGTPILSELKHQTSVETSEGGSLQLAHENWNAHLRRQSFLIASGRPLLPTPPSPGASH